MPRIELDNVTIKYEDKKQSVTVFKNFSAVIENNKTTVIMGESGSGKTTLVKAIIGLIDPEEGRITFDGRDMVDESVFNRNVSYVSQELALYPHINIYKNIAFPLKIKGVPYDEIRERVYDVACKLHIEHCLTRKPRHLSLGQNQRVSIARAIIKRPDVYFFDEPFSNLDRQTSVDLRIELKKIIGEIGGTVVFVTHNREDAMALADNIIVLKNGEIIAQGPKEQVYDSINPDVRVLFEQ